MSRQDVLDTIWEAPDDLWEKIEPVIGELDPPKATGRKREDPRRMLNAIIFRMRSGCQWNKLPKSLGDDSTIHRTFQRWESAGVLPRVWAVIQAHCDELGGVDWEWQAADAAMGKARWGGCGRTESDRPRQAGNQAQYPCGSKRRTIEHCGGRGERPRYQTTGEDSGICGGRASCSE